MSDDQEFAGENLIADVIDAAEDIRDPLDDLVERTAADFGSPFEPEVLQRLAELKKDDLAAFEALRSKLKKASCRVTALDDAIAEEMGDTGGRRPTQADILIELAQAAELFHTPDSTGFAELDINGHRETWAIRAKGFRRWLARCFFEATQGALSSDALQSALNVIEAKAHFDAPERIVYIRVGGLDGRMYLDRPATGMCWLLTTSRACRRGFPTRSAGWLLNGTQAAIRAGYSPNTAAEQAFDLMNQ